MKLKCAVIFVFALLVFSSIPSGQQLKNTDKIHYSSEPCSVNVDSKILGMMNQITHSMVYEFHQSLMSFGARYTGSENCTKAGQYLLDTFSELGLQTNMHPWKMDGFESANVEATIPGTNPSDGVIYILSAHYDCTKGSLGANDDGSGIAALLAIAKVMASHDFPNTIKFVAFSGEEVGTYGSYNYARDAYRNQDDIKAVLNLDMIGYADTVEGGKKLRFHCPKRSEWIASKSTQISLCYQDHVDMLVEGRPNYIGADHQAFVDYGYDGVWIAHPDGYSYANTPNDNPEYLNWSYQLKATKLLCIILAELASEPMNLHVQLIHPYEGFLYIRNKPIVSLNLGRLWAKELRAITLLFGPATSEVYVKSDADVEYVVFCLNNNFMYFDQSEPYSWQIRGRHAPPIGSYTLRVYVYDVNGNVASDEMDIFSLSTQYHYRPW